MSDLDRELATRAQAGGREAFDALVGRHGPAVLAYLRRVLGRDDAMDGFQETFLRAYKSLPQLAQPARFRAWLWVIAANTARKRFGSRRDPTLVDTGVVESSDEDSADRGSDALVRDERTRAVQAAIGRLPERQREVVAMRLHGGLSFAEIGDALGIRADNARANHYQAVKALRRMLEPQLTTRKAADGSKSGAPRAPTPRRTAE